MQPKQETEAEMQARWDAETLLNAQEIERDAPRHKRALAALGRLQRETEKRVEGMVVLRNEDLGGPK
uniref:Uncharacterized protein n=1 Tax=viral metagenome TaxID=1070528 RepID=A0A6M3J8T5_9ZZZZ